MGQRLNDRLDAVGPHATVAEAQRDRRFSDVLGRAAAEWSSTGSAAFTGREIAVLFLVLGAVVSVPLFSHPLPPLSDYVNHLARMHVISVATTDPDLSRFYRIEWAAIPNLMMDLIVPLLERVMNVYLAGQVYTVACFTLIMSGTLALNRALHGRWSALPLVAFPLLYNNVFLVGVMNYIFGIGLVLWSLAIWVTLRERNWFLRNAVLTAMVVALFFCHLFAVGVYGLGLLAFELLRLWNGRRKPLGRQLVDFFSCGVQFLPVIPLLLASPTWSLSGENFWEPRGKVDGLMYVIEVYSDYVAFALTAIVVLSVVWAVRQRVLKLHQFGWMLLGVGGLVYLAMPRVMFETYMADQRLPIALAFMVIACAHLEFQSRTVCRVFATVLVTLLAVRVTEVQTMWTRLSAQTVELAKSVHYIDRGSKVLVAYADLGAGEDVRDLGLVHAPCLAMIERSSLVTTAFTVVGKQILRVRPAYRDRVDTDDGTPPSLEQLRLSIEPAPDQRHHYWDRWPDRFDYVYVLFTEPGADNPDPSHLSLVQEGARFQLYRVHATTIHSAATE